MSLTNVRYHALSYFDDANSSNVSSDSKPCLDTMVLLTWSRSVITSCPIEVAPTMAIGVPDLVVSSSASSTLY
ncbi:MAG: hypothetical protein ACKVJ3_07795, partial [bacterium]